MPFKEGCSQNDFVNVVFFLIYIYVLTVEFSSKFYFCAENLIWKEILKLAIHREKKPKPVKSMIHIMTYGSHMTEEEF